MRNFRAVRRLIGLLLTLASAAMLTAPAHSQNTAQNADGIYQSRANDVVLFLNGARKAEDVFAPAFLAAVPPAQLAEITQSLRTQYGQAVGARVVGKQGAFAGQIEVDFPAGIATMELVLEPNAPYRIVGLLITGFRQSGDNFAALSRDFAALPGAAGYAVAELTAQGPRPVAGYNADARFAIGSTFKLYILAELTAQVQRGARRWGDVVPLNSKSLPSGITQDWPNGAPMTLHSLASLMISISDNTATDTLLFTLGRGAVGQRVVASGHTKPADMIPFLGTREAFALKMPAVKNLRQSFESNGDVGQERILNANRDTLYATQVDPALLLSRPMYIDTVEWFASPADLVALLSHMHAMGDPTMLDIMSINKGIGGSDAGRWRYLGYKGGSETGVINMTFLGQREDGRWFAITGSWNNKDAAVTDTQFVALMTRALNLLVE